jgi:hypothetical protein
MSAVTDTIEIETSPSRTLYLAGLGIFMTALGAVIALDAIPDEQLGTIERAFGAAAALFFGVCTLIWLWRLVAGRGPMLTISPQGICDKRVARETIPWSAVRKISTWEYSGQRILVLDVDPAVERTLHLTTIAKWTRRVNRSLGADGLCVTAQGLKISYDQLWELAARYAPPARS